MSMPDYDRRTVDENGNPVVEEAAEFKDGPAWPGMVRLQTFSRDCSVVRDSFRGMQLCRLSFSLC